MSSVVPATSVSMYIGEAGFPEKNLRINKLHSFKLNFHIYFLRQGFIVVQVGLKLALSLRMTLNFSPCLHVPKTVIGGFAMLSLSSAEHGNQGFMSAMHRTLQAELHPTSSLILLS